MTLNSRVTFLESGWRPRREDEGIFRQGEGRWHGADAFYVLFSVSFAPYVRVLGSLASVSASTTFRGFDGPFPSSDKITKYSPLLAICGDFRHLSKSARVPAPIMILMSLYPVLSSKKTSCHWIVTVSTVAFSNNGPGAAHKFTPTRS
jgi:hypothetical protein